MSGSLDPDMADSGTEAGPSDAPIPYLYAISLNLKNGGKLVFGELAHYGPGMLQDYAQLFALASSEQARYALELLGMKRRIANKYACPCGCGVRLGRCRFRHRLLPLRRLASRGCPLGRIRWEE